MGIVEILTPPPSLYVFGPVVAHDMLRRRELCRVCQGERMRIPADVPIDMGIAFGRGMTPPVKLRFTACPGRTYQLYWLAQGFGAGMGVAEHT